MTRVESPTEDQDKERRKREFKLRIYNYVIRLIRFLVKFPKEEVIREIKSQLIRSGTSVGANYFEAEGASSKNDYQRFFSYALKSANESRFWLPVLKDSDLTTKQLSEENEYLIKETTELANIFASSILTMKGKR